MESNWQKSQYVLRVWFVYRHFYRNPSMLENEKYKAFYDVADKYFMEKYRLDSKEQTRKGIEQLFQYESERLIIINEKSINQIIDTYYLNPNLLAI